MPGGPAPWMPSEARPLSASEPAASYWRSFFIELGRRRFHRREALGRHRGGVLVLGQPLLGLGGRVLVADDALAGCVVLVDLGEQLVDQVLGLDLADHLALR